ncbi:MAG TPA: PQQ-binding-like beta-propeller repeat protein, partial [Nitrososphaerales archaeon]|nr:PQQ-binding-like beta-propeller repeat protein [Nitrososphaerales archaeon]
EFPDGLNGQNYNPQNQINSSNVQYLGLAWIFPIPTAPTSLSSLVNGFAGVGVGMPVIIVNGTAFATTSFDTTIAFNVANGNVLWTFLSPLGVNQTKGEATGPLPLHSHDGNEWFSTATFGAGVSGPTLWFQGMNNLVYAINALTGKQELNFSDFTGLNMVAGNNPQSIYNGIGASNIVINEKLGILVSGHDAELDADNGRGFFAGWNLNTNPVTMKWITYDVPPQPGSPTAALNPNWTTQMIANISQNAGTFYPGKNGTTNGYTTPTEVRGGLLVNTNNNIVVDWKHMSAAEANASLYNDWGQSQQTAQCLAIDGGGSTGSTGSAWGGSWVVGSGQSAGMVYVGTNNKDPFAGPCNPGPDLWSASVIALNMTTGHWIWAFQTTTHDIWDYDCSWWQGLANATIAGVNTEVLMKTCKNGYLYEFNAVTGNLIWAWDPPSGIQTPGSSRCPICFPYNPENASMVGEDFPTALTNCAPTWTITCMRGPQPPFLQWPPQLAGFESEQSIVQSAHTIIATGHIVPDYEGYFGLNASTYFSSLGESGVPCPNCGQLFSNATTWAINIDTGALLWHNTIAKNQGYRGITAVSGNVVYTMLSSGDIDMLNAATGTLLRDYYVGAPMANGISVGASVSGQEFLILPVGSCSPEAVSTCPGTTPGDIVALTLQNVPTQTTTSTATVTSTSTTTTTSVSTTTLPGQTSTITTTLGNGQVVTTTITGTATTVTLSGGGTTTVTTTASSGGSNTALYGVAAVAVIFIIATGYLAMRGRKPAS